MDDSLAVRCGQTLCNLQRVIRGLAHRQSIAIHLLPQRFAFQQFTDEIRRSIVHPGIEHRQHIRMIQCRQCLRLLLESAQPIRIACEILRQHLHRHVAIEPRVARPKHFPHPARAYRGDDFIGTNPSSWEHGFVDLVQRRRSSVDSALKRMNIQMLPNCSSDRAVSSTARKSVAQRLASGSSPR